MESDFFIDTYFNGINQTLTKEQQGYILNLENIFKNNLRDDFGLLCNVYLLYKTCKGSTFTDNGAISTAMITKQYRFTELLGKFFGLSERYIYRLKQISGKFIDFVAGDKKFKIPELQEYSISKLQELLPVSLDSIKQAFSEKMLTYKSTRADIRNYVKTLKGTTPNKVIEENKQTVEQVVDTVANDTEFYVSVAFPEDVYEFIKEQVLKYKKASSLADYVISLVREKMKE